MTDDARPIIEFGPVESADGTKGKITGVRHGTGWSDVNEIRVEWDDGTINWWDADDPSIRRIN